MEAEKNGGKVIAGAPFTFLGARLRSLLLSHRWRLLCDSKAAYIVKSLWLLPLQSRQQPLPAWLKAFSIWIRRAARQCHGAVVPEHIVVQGVHRRCRE